jgi:hypothetical protein
MLIKTIRRVDAGPRSARFAQALAVAARASACAFLVGICSGQTAGAVDAVCQTLLDASTKQRAMPTHIYMTRNIAPGGAQSKVSESIYAGGAIYVLVNGKWSRSPISPQALQKQAEENAKKAKQTCRYLRDESVNGEGAAVYSARSESEGSKSDSLLWISKSRGLPLKTEMDLDVGQKDKSHMSIRYEYGNVQPPAGMK